MNTPQLKGWLFLLHYPKNSLSPHAEIRLKVTKVTERDIRLGSCNYIMESDFPPVSISLCFQVPSGHSLNYFTPELLFQLFLVLFFIRLVKILLWSKLPSSHSRLILLDRSKYFSVLCTGKGINYFGDTSREIQLEGQ